jgi:hypothetical protein
MNYTINEDKLATFRHRILILTSTATADELNHQTDTWNSE